MGILCQPLGGNINPLSISKISTHYYQNCLKNPMQQALVSFHIVLLVVRNVAEADDLPDPFKYNR